MWVVHPSLWGHTCHHVLSCLTVELHKSDTMCNVQLVVLIGPVTVGTWNFKLRGSASLRGCAPPLKSCNQKRINVNYNELMITVIAFNPSKGVLVMHQKISDKGR